MKRYLIFAWMDYEQAGGWDDLIGSESEQTDATETAINALSRFVNVAQVVEAHHRRTR